MMDDGAAVRDAARAAIEDIEPSRLRDLIGSRLEGTAAMPGVLTRMSAHAAGGPDASVDLDRRVAGVQLIYEGLSLTRSMARAPPWEDGSTDAADLDLLVANVLVARGFYLLARTDAAEAAVETVRSFGRDETAAGERDGEEARPGKQGAEEAAVGGEDPEAGALEVDVFELAIVAGVSAVGVAPSSGSRAFAADLVRSLPEADGRLPEGIDVALESLVGGDGLARPTREGIGASSATDP
jgi:hypothetical protein